MLEGEEMSIKQDGARVRTAHDLEQKYNLAGMKKAFEQNDKTITRINQILQDFVNTIIGTLEDFVGLEDGNLTTYFYNGVPTLRNYPAQDWSNLDIHVKDLYYDRDTGKAYIFKNEGTEYFWEETTDKEKIKVLALANATTDTKDNRRRIFVEQPVPPYDNGDLWVKDGEIYVCQISKPITESYEEFDFIILGSYGGDTIAVKTGKELAVLKGTVLKVKEDADYLRVSLDNLDSETGSKIELLQQQMSTLIVDSSGQSMMKQTGDGWTFEIQTLVETVDETANKVSGIEEELNVNSSELNGVKEAISFVEEKTAYIHLKTFEGKPAQEFGVEDGMFKLILTNEEIMFEVDSKYPTIINNEHMVIERAKINKELQISTMAWVERANGHLSFIPKGVI